MCMCRFDYNIALSLGLILNIHYHAHNFKTAFRYSGIACLVFSGVDIIWGILVMYSWLFEAPKGGDELTIFNAYLKWRWVTFVCAAVSCAIKVGQLNPRHTLQSSCSLLDICINT